jgi:hypothetical protein
MKRLDGRLSFSLLSGLLLIFSLSQDAWIGPITMKTQVDAWVPSITKASSRSHRHPSNVLESLVSPLCASKVEYDCDLAVIGGGVVGVQAALCAASAPYSRRVCLIDAPREAGVLMAGDEDLSIGAPTGLFSKALRDTSKRIKVATLRGMGLRDDRYVES